MGPEVVADLSAQDWIPVVLGSGLVSAALTKTADAVLDRQRRRSEHTQQTEMQTRELESRRELLAVDQEGQRALQAEAREHEALQLLITAHAGAREKFVVSAAAVEDWLQHEWGSAYGSEGDWVPEFEPSPKLKTVTDVLAVLRRVEAEHPTRGVRALTRELRDDVSDHYGRIRIERREPGDYIERTGTTPSADQFAKWAGMAHDLLERIHGVPDLGEVRRSGGSHEPAG